MNYSIRWAKPSVRRMKSKLLIIFPSDMFVFLFIINKNIWLANNFLKFHCFEFEVQSQYKKKKKFNINYEKNN